METRRRFAAALLAVATLLLAGAPAGAAGGFPLAGGHAIQDDAAYAASYAARGVATVAATTQRASCYTPEVPFFAITSVTLSWPAMICLLASSTFSIMDGESRSLLY